MGCDVQDKKTTEIEKESVPKSKILFQRPTIYSSLLFSNDPIATVLRSHDYTNGDILNLNVFQRNWGQNTIIFDSTAPFCVEQTDSFEIADSVNRLSPCIRIHHRSRIIPRMPNKTMSDDEAIAIADTMITIKEDITPIEITQPIFDQCNNMPYCWYRDMEIGWNADPENVNGVVIIVAWTGVKIQESTTSSAKPIYNIDLVEDNGYTTLNNDLFQGIPENALVTLILLRANIVRVEIDDEEYLLDPNSYEVNSDGVSDFIHDFLYPRIETLLHSYTIAVGSEAHFSFVLIRDSYGI